MHVKKIILFLCLGFCMGANAAESIGQTLQINTHFRSVVGKPVWLLIVRDVNSNKVSPYLYDVLDNENFWIALTYGHAYRVTASTVTFGPDAVIHNFCHIEDGILAGKSMIITVSGELTPAPSTSTCHVLQYNGAAFPIVPPQQKESK